jgi:hypothetical protein
LRPSTPGETGPEHEEPGRARRQPPACFQAGPRRLAAASPTPLVLGIEPAWQARHLTYEALRYGRKRRVSEEIACSPGVSSLVADLVTASPASVLASPRELRRGVWRPSPVALAPLRTCAEPSPGLGRRATSSSFRLSARNRSAPGQTRNARRVPLRSPESAGGWPTDRHRPEAALFQGPPLLQSSFCNAVASFLALDATPGSLPVQGMSRVTVPSIV